MAFDNITSSEIAVDKPITNELLTKFVNRDDFVNAQVGTIGAITISNPSFEVDSDSDGQPDNWTPTFFTGGTGAIDTAVSVHGAQSYKFTHPGGAGNGGGQTESDFFSVSCLAGYSIEYAERLEGGAVPGAVVVRYNRNQSTIDEVSLVGSTATGATGVWTQRSYGFVPSSVITVNSSVAYIKLRLIGGSSDHSTAGTVNFDNVSIKEMPNASAGNYAVASRESSFTVNATSTLANYTIFSALIREPGGYRLTLTESTLNNYINVLLNGSVLTTVLTNSSGFTYNFQATANSTGSTGGNSVRRLKPGDEVHVRFRAADSTATPRVFENIKIGVKDARHGMASLNTTNSTVAT